MSRKRSSFNILKDDSISSTPNQPSAEDFIITTRKRRTKVQCFCSGNLVDPRTKKAHDKKATLEPSFTGETHSPVIPPEETHHSAVIPPEGTHHSPVIPPEETPISRVFIEPIVERHLIPTISDSDVDEEQTIIFLPRKKRVKTNTLRHITDEITENDDSNGNDEFSEYSNDDADDDRNNDGNDDEFFDVFEDYSHPAFDLPEISKLPKEDRFTWILIWIMKFRSNYNLPNTATEALIKFVKILLKDCENIDHESFPNTLYKAKKSLGLVDQFTSFAACQKCHKLYSKDDVTNIQRQTVMKCSHIEFPNSSTKRFKECETPLAKQISLNNRIAFRPELVYPMASIRQQIYNMFQQPEFEKSLRHWSNRPIIDNVLSDIYDGQIWRSLKTEQGDNFFRPDKADTNLGLMVNLDWFQPYDRSIHSTGVIYATICNLPRNIRFQPKNMLILGILPGPNEVGLHKINHYLSPIITDLESLWEGMALNRTHEHPNGKVIRAALMIASCDIPAARKLCGHVSALASCHRCEKKSNYVDNHHNFGGMGDMAEWFIMKDSTNHRENALNWRRCKSNAERTRFVKQNGVRWSELLRLPYFDPIRFVVIDPMHCLFLGIAKWIMKRIWVDESILSQNTLRSIQKKMDEFQVPADLGRIPGKIYSGEGFTNFTADQWKNFFLIYATVVLWDHLSSIDRKILTYFVRVCTILVRRIVDVNEMEEAHMGLIEIIRLIEEKYGEGKISPNLHLSLHLCECTYDYGPLYSFWCFSFERMNGFLGKIDSSFKCIFTMLFTMLSYFIRKFT